MDIIRYTLLIFIVLICGCKQSSHNQKNQTQSVEVNKDHQTMKNDTIKYDFNLTMEWAIREDKLVVTDNTIQGKVKQKIIGLDSVFKKSDLQKSKFKDNVLDVFIEENLYRTKKKEGALRILNVYKNDQITTLYSYNLSDRGKFIQEYFKIMKSIYPKSKVFN